MFGPLNDEIKVHQIRADKETSESQKKLAVATLDLSQLHQIDIRIMYESILMIVRVQDSARSATRDVDLSFSTVIYV